MVWDGRTVSQWETHSSVKERYLKGTNPRILYREFVRSSYQPGIAKSDQRYPVRSIVLKNYYAGNNNIYKEIESENSLSRVVGM